MSFHITDLRFYINNMEFCCQDRSRNELYTFYGRKGRNLFDVVVFDFLDMLVPLHTILCWGAGTCHAFCKAPSIECFSVWKHLFKLWWQNVLQLGILIMELKMGSRTGNAMVSNGHTSSSAIMVTSASVCVSMTTAEAAMVRVLHQSAGCSGGDSGSAISNAVIQYFTPSRRGCSPSRRGPGWSWTR